MNPRVKKLWVEGLLSGEFPQGIGQLRTTDNKYCCLGVLNELYRRDTGRGTWAPALNGGYKFLDEPFDYSTSFLTEGVRKWAGLPSVCPAVLLDNEEIVLLTHLNDVCATPFDKIASLINDSL